MCYVIRALYIDLSLIDDEYEEATSAIAPETMHDG